MEVEGCRTPENAVEGPSRLVWRVLLRRSVDGTVSIEQAETFRYPEALERPSGPLSGDVVLAAQDAAGGAVDESIVRFPKELLSEAAGPGRPRVTKPLPASDATAFLIADERIERLVVLNSNDTELDAVEVGPPEAALDPDLSQDTQGLLPVFATGPCAHVEILEGPSDAASFPAVLRPDFELLELDPTQYAVIRSGLGKLTPLLCAGIHRVAVVAGLEEDVKGMVSFRAGDTIMLNGDEDWEEFDEWGFDAESLEREDMRAWLHFFLAHEAAHTVQALMDVDVRDDITAANRDIRSRQLARETTDFMRLRGGLMKEWIRIHESFEKAGLAGGFVKDNFGDPPSEDELLAYSPEQMAAHGLISMYGGTRPSEDFAEFVSLPLMADTLSAAGIPRGNAYGRLRDLGCAAMRAHQEKSLPSDLATVFTKLSFVRDLGAIEPSHFEGCAGPQITVQADRVGTTIRQDGQTLRHFGGSPEAAIGSTQRSWVFDYTVEGEAEFGGTIYPATLRLVLRLAGLDEVDGVEQVSWPRGFFFIRPGEPASFSLRMPDAPAGNFDVIDGLALVTSADDQRIEGAVVVDLVERRQAPAPVPIPEAFTPSLVFRFLLEN